MVDNAPNRGYNKITIKQRTKQITRNGAELESEDNDMTTKEQERKALAKIRKIVEELGENSYIGTAFEGCFEIAEDNIDNDFVCSMKQRAEGAEKNVEIISDELMNIKADVSKLTTENEKLKAKILTTAEAEAIKAILSHSKLEAGDMAGRSAQRIVELADNPDSAEFRQAVQDNRQSKKRLTECDTLIQRLLETIK